MTTPRDSLNTDTSRGAPRRWADRLSRHIGGARAWAGRAGDTAWNPAFLDNRPRPLRNAWRVLVALLVLIVLVWLLLFITKGRFLKSPFESITSSVSHRDVRAGGDFQLYFAPFSLKFRAENMRIANPEWAGKQPFFTASLIDTRINPFSLLLGPQRLTSLVLDKGRVDLRWNADGKRNNWSFGNPDSAGKPLDMPVIRRALIAGTQVEYRDPRLRLAVRINVDTIRTSRKGFDRAIRFSGNGSMRSRDFSLTGSMLSPNETLKGGGNRLTLDARAQSTHLNVQGTLPGATRIEGAQLHLTAKGRNIARLFDFIGVASPPTRNYSVRSRLTYLDDVWTFTRIDGDFGDSDVAGKLTVSEADGRVMLDGNLATRTLDILDAGPFVGYDPQRLEAQGASGAIRDVSGRPRVLPDAPLRLEAVQSFDANIHWTVQKMRADNLQISDIDLSFALDRGNMRLHPFTMNVAGGELDSDIAVSARALPVRSSFDIRLSPTPMGRLLANWGVEDSGTSGTVGGRLLLKGVGDTVHETLATSNGRIAIILPQGTMWARNAQLSELDIGTFIQKMFEKKLKDPVEINCGLIAFTVRDGVAAADPILIDTKKNVILGRGGFSFKTEALDMAVRADGKTFSLFSGQSPIGIDGYFADPAISPISGELAGRAGLSLGLAAFINPLAGVLSFIDPGDAKAAQCEPVLAGARASAQRTQEGGIRDDVGRGTTSKSENGSASSQEKANQRGDFLGRKRD